MPPSLFKLARKVIDPVVFSRTARSAAPRGPDVALVNHTEPAICTHSEQRIRAGSCTHPRTQNGLRLTNPELNLVCRCRAPLLGQKGAHVRAARNRRFALYLVVGCAALGVGCRCNDRARGGSDSGMLRSAAAPAVSSAAERALLSGGEGASSDPLWFIAPPEQAWQRLAFSSSRWAALEDEELVVRHLPELRVLARLRVPGARNLVTAADAAFLVVAADHVYRLAETELQPELLPHIPRLGPSTVLPNPARGEQLTLAYEGILDLSTFSLGMPALAGYAPLVRSTKLPGFDGRALLGLADESVVYSCSGGLCREEPAGAVQRLELPDSLGMSGGWRAARVLTKSGL